MKIYRKKQIICFSIITLVISGFLFWKACHGYIFNDEPFMISVGHRLIKGDQLFLHEWNTSQLIGLFLSRLFMLLHHSLAEQKG